MNIICGLLKENKYALFLRKVHKSFPDNVIKELQNKYQTGFRILIFNDSEKDRLSKSYFENNDKLPHLKHQLHLSIYHHV